MGILARFRERKQRKLAKIKEREQQKIEAQQLLDNLEDKLDGLVWNREQSDYKEHSRGYDSYSMGNISIDTEITTVNYRTRIQGILVQFTQTEENTYVDDRRECGGSELTISARVGDQKVTRQKYNNRALFERVEKAYKEQ